MLALKVTLLVPDVLVWNQSVLVGSMSVSISVAGTGDGVSNAQIVNVDVASAYHDDIFFPVFLYDHIA